MPKNYLARVLKANGSTAGSAFLITRKHILTCTHVVNYVFGDEKKPSQSFEIEFPAVPDSRIKVKVCKKYCFPSIVNHKGISDITVLEIEDNLPTGCKAGLFFNGNNVDAFVANGFPKDADTEERVTHGKIAGSMTYRWLQAEAEHGAVGHHIQPGFSGAPALLKDKEQIIGMIAAYDDTKGNREGFIIPTDCLYQALGLPTNWKNTEKTIGAMELFELKELLADLDIPKNKRQSFLQQFLPEIRSLNKIEQNSLPNFLCFLAQLQHTSSDKAPLIEFLEFIHARIIPTLQADLLVWKKSVTERLNINLDTVKARVNFQQQQIQVNEPPIIFLEIEPENWISTERFKLLASAYQNGNCILQKNSEIACSIGELEALLPEILNEIQGFLEIDAIIEIILPITLFNWKINHIQVKLNRTVTKPIGRDYSFNIRSWDRIRNYEKIYKHTTQKLWEKKWQDITGLNKIENEHIHCISDHNTCCSMLLDELEQNTLVFIPLFGLSSFEGGALNIFDTVISAGLPFIFWIPESQIDNQTQQEIEVFLSSCSHEDWMVKIQEKKSQQTFWNDFMVLWDNPERPVPESECFIPSAL